MTPSCSFNPIVAYIRVSVSLSCSLILSIGRKLLTRYHMDQGTTRSLKLETFLSTAFRLISLLSTKIQPHPQQRRSTMSSANLSHFHSGRQIYIPCFVLYLLHFSMTKKAKNLSTSKSKSLHRQRMLPMHLPCLVLENYPHWYSHSAKDATTTRKEEGEEEQQPYSSSWDCLKKQLIEFHDTAKVLYFKSLVEFWNHDGRMNKNSLGGSVTLPFEHAGKLYGIATMLGRSRGTQGGSSGTQS